LIEIVIGGALILLSLVGLIGAYTFYLNAGLRSADTLKASFLLQEGVEAVTLMRDASWSNLSSLSSGMSYYLAWNGSTWVSTTTATTTDGFTRIFWLDDVYRRNSDRDIVDATSPDAKSLDAGTKKLTLRVIYGTTATTSIAFTNGTTDGSLGSFPSNNAGDGDVAESFTTGNATSTIKSAELFLKRVGNPSVVYLEIRSGSTVGPVVGTSEQVAPSSIPSSALTWTVFSFGGAPALTPNTTYYLRLRSTPDSTVAFSGSSGTLNWGYLQGSGSAYVGGQAYRYIGRQSNPTDGGQALSQYDFGFKINTRIGGFDKQVVTYLTNLFE
jgi:hypothetical protein